MKNVGLWRWPLVIGLPLIAGSLLVWRGLVRLVYEGQAILVYSGSAKQLELEPKIFLPHRGAKVTFEKVAGQPRQIAMHAEGAWPAEVVNRMLAVSRVWAEQSLTEQKMKLKKEQDGYQEQILGVASTYDQLMQKRATLLAGSVRNTPRASVVAKLEELKARRRRLIEQYPTHTDIPLLAKQIQDLLKQLGKRPEPLMERLSDLDRQINETKVRKDYFTRRLRENAVASRGVKPHWAIVEPVKKTARPHRVDSWPLGAGVVGGVFVLSMILFRGEHRMKNAANGLWRPEAEALRTAPATPVELEVVSPERSQVPVPLPEAPLPSDPLTQKAADLYSKWVELAKTLYEPAPEPPQGILDQVGPLLQESSDFLPEGHDVLARYLAHSVVSGNLAAHVARTVLMTLTGAQEAGVSPEHRLAMSLAALFHDLAIVPRPFAAQDEVGSEVGRLSASVLRKIPGLQPAILSMVEDILIGMDEFKLETWQNAANGNTLEPLSKVLREIDRFEKVMQKQKSRIDRRAPTARIASL